MLVSNSKPSSVMEAILSSLSDTDFFPRRYNITTNDVPRGFTAKNNNE